MDHSIVACVFVAAGTCLRSCCLAIPSLLASLFRLSGVRATLAKEAGRLVLPRTSYSSPQPELEKVVTVGRWDAAHLVQQLNSVVCIELL
jgi:hypothetical protein